MNKIVKVEFIVKLDKALQKGIDRFTYKKSRVLRCKVTHNITCLNYILVRDKIRDNLNLNTDSYTGSSRLLCTRGTI